MADSGAVNAPNLIEIVKEEIEAVFHSGAPPETHGTRKDIDENTALDDVKAPNVFERVKEEVLALVETSYAKKRDETTGESETKFDLIAADSDGDEKISEANKIKERSPLHHHKETHGTSNDINEDTPIDAVKAPNLFQRAKEEVEAFVQTIHPKKETFPKREGGFRLFIAKVLEKVCHPWNPKKD